MNRSKPIIIGITGGSASGKTYITKKLKDRITNIGLNIVTIEADMFYKDKSKEDLIKIKNNCYNFDDPNTIDFQSLKKTIIDLKHGKKCFIPYYDFETSRIIKGKYKDIIENNSWDVIIVEGLFVLYEKLIYDLLDIKIFIDTNIITRFTRRLERNEKIRKSHKTDKLKKYILKYVEPAYNKLIFPTRKDADLILNGENETNSNIEIFYLFIINFLKVNRKKLNNINNYYSENQIIGL